MVVRARISDRAVQSDEVAARAEHDAGLALDARTLCEAFQRTAERYADAPALRVAGGGAELTWRDYAERVEDIAVGLAGVGIGPGDTVALMLTNRPEAFLVDVAALHLGAIPFSIYNTSAPEQIEYLLDNADCGLVLTEAQFAECVLAATARVASPAQVFVVDDPVPVGARSFAELESTGLSGFDVGAAWRQATPGDVATLIYTSGTTGPPKGVELTHANLLAQLRLVHDVLGLVPGGRHMSYLPMAHLADRMMALYPAILSGACVTCVADARQAVAALPETRPTMWVGVPRIWEKLKAALEARFAGGASSADPETLAAIRTQLGFDEDTLLLSGAAPIAKEVLEFFASLGLTICEVWGLTETSAIATANPRDAVRIGTVGRALPGVEVALAADGELLVRGPIVMRGYRKAPERTADAIDRDGWLHTGDIGDIDEDGYVRIVDRKKELIINAAGKNMSPANIENRIKAQSVLIGSAVAIGDGRPYNTALIVLDPDAAAAFAQSKGMPDAAIAVLAADPRVQAEVAAAIDRANAQLSRVEQIKKHTLLPVDWAPGGDELTPTMKLRRKPIAEKYTAAIEAMYGH